MKLYATVSSERGKTAKLGDDKWLEIELTCGNSRVGTIILDYQGGKDWELSYQRGGEPSYLIDSCITPKTIDTKAKRQKDEYCNECMSTPCQQQ